MRKSFILLVVMCLAIVGGAQGDAVCLVISPSNAGVNDQVTLSAYDASDNWVDMRNYTVIEICFDDGLCIFSGGGGLDVSSGDGVFTLTQAILDGYKFDCDFYSDSPPPDSTWFTLVNPSEGNPAFTSIAEAIAAGGDCTMSTDTNPPTPDPMTWATVPYGYTATSIRMVATTASDQSGVEYYFEETSGNPGGSDSGWQDSETYTDSDLNPVTQYCYRVQTRDKSAGQNTGGWSTPDACSETAAAGETLYNGIVLPQTWPPQYGSVPYEPMPVPYLDSPPAVVPIDVGRQLFVDDFLVETTDMTQTYHQATYYTAGNPVLTPTTVEEHGPEGNMMAGPFSGGSWYDPADNLFKMWYRGGMAGVHPLQSQLYATSTDGKNWDRPKLDVNPVGLLEHFTCSPSNPSAGQQVTIAAFDQNNQQVDLAYYDTIEFCFGWGGVICIANGSGITIDGNGGAVFTCTQAILDVLPFSENVDFLAEKTGSPSETEHFKLPFPFDSVSMAGNSVYPFSEDDAYYRDSVSILLDHDAPASERYKWFATEFPGGGTQLTYRTSPDGIHWSGPLNTKHIYGDRTTVFYNPFRDVWVCSQRSENQFGENRSYVEGTSPSDLINNVEYNDGVTVTLPGVFWVGGDYLDPRHTDPLFSHFDPWLYTLDAMPYESLMLGQFSIWNGPDYAGSEQYWVPKRVDILLGFSRDGFHWDRPDRTRFISSTWDPLSWRMGNVQSVVGSPLVVGDELFFYFNARPKPAPDAPDWDGDYQAGLAMLRRDGFASMDASGSTKTLTTRPVQFTGKYLYVNVDCPAGDLKVEVLNTSDQVISPFTLASCDAISDDTTRKRVTWGANDDLSALAGTPVKFRFSLTDGSLYAFWV
ncbi:MAG: hypothetical protein ACYSOI_09815, partial [Planctomycetota bacterium]